jgi:putative heme-binding domain-containing protein
MRLEVRGCTGWRFYRLIIVISAIAPAVLAKGTAAMGPGDVIRPVAVWPSGPLDVTLAFDRPLDAGRATSYIGRAITYGETPTGEPNRPLPTAPSGKLRIVGTRAIDGGRTLVLATDPHPRVARYHLPLSFAPGGPRSKGLGDVTVPYDLSGVEVIWSAGDDPPDRPSWSGWWPQLDLEETRRLTRGSVPHEAGFARLSRPGRLTLSALMRLPLGKHSVRIASSGPIDEAALGDAQAAGSPPASRDGDHHAVLEFESRGEPLFFTATVRTGPNVRPFSVRVVGRLQGETADAPIARERLILPWAPMVADAAATPPVAIPDLSGGDPVRGKALFAGDQARCAQCHAFRGQGGKVGPDLTDVGRKGRAEIYRSIALPSAVIEPDYTSYTIAAKAGQIAVGVVRAEGPDAIKVTDTNARETVIHRDQIQEIRPSATSIMPPGMAAALGDAAVRDIIAYLTSAGPSTPAKTQTTP